MGKSDKRDSRHVGILQIPHDEKRTYQDLADQCCHITPSLDNCLRRRCLGQDTNGMMNVWKYISIVISTAIIVGIGTFGLRAYKNQIANKRNSVVYEKQAAIAKQKSCKQRGVDYEKQVENIEQDAHNQLKIGTKKADVAKFFSEHSIPFDFFESEASGTLSTSGCAPIGCGTDSALIGVSVKLSQAGAVTEEPKVVALYTDCL